MFDIHMGIPEMEAYWNDLALTFSDNIPETYNRENPVIGLRYMNRYPLRIFVKRSEYCFAF